MVAVVAHVAPLAIGPEQQQLRQGSVLLVAVRGDGGQAAAIRAVTWSVKVPLPPVAHVADVLKPVPELVLELPRLEGQLHQRQTMAADFGRAGVASKHEALAVRVDVEHHAAGIVAWQFMGRAFEQVGHTACAHIKR